MRQVRDCCGPSMCWVGPGAGCCGYGPPTEASDAQQFDCHPEDGLRAASEPRGSGGAVSSNTLNGESAPLVNATGRSASVGERLSRLLPAALTRVFSSRLTTSGQNGGRAQSRKDIAGHTARISYGTASSVGRRATGRIGAGDNADGGGEDSLPASYQSNHSFLKPSLPSSSDESLAEAADGDRPAAPAPAPQYAAYAAQLSPPPVYPAFAARAASPTKSLSLSAGGAQTQSHTQTKTLQSGREYNSEQWTRPELRAPENGATLRADRDAHQYACNWGVQQAHKSRTAYFTQSQDAL